MVSPFYTAVYAVVRRIPPGRVATYGQVARVAGHPGAARQVGYAMFALPAGTDVPWHRVINAKGEISYSEKRRGHDDLQRKLLEDEGIGFDDSGRVDLGRCGWVP